MFSVGPGPALRRYLTKLALQFRAISAVPCCCVLARNPPAYTRGIWWGTAAYTSAGTSLSRRAQSKFQLLVMSSENSRHLAEGHSTKCRKPETYWISEVTLLRYLVFVKFSIILIPSHLKRFEVVILYRNRWSSVIKRSSTEFKAFYVDEVSVALMIANLRSERAP